MNQVYKNNNGYTPFHVEALNEYHGARITMCLVTPPSSPPHIQLKLQLCSYTITHALDSHK